MATVAGLAIAGVAIAEVMDMDCGLGRGMHEIPKLLGPGVFQGAHGHIEWEIQGIGNYRKTMVACAFEGRDWRDLVESVDLQGHNSAKSRQNMCFPFNAPSKPHYARCVVK